MNIKSVTIRVTGRVQGVFFRSNTREKAMQLNVAGWVKNESNGDVLIVAEGEEANLLKFLEWCSKGSELSRVDNVAFEWRSETKDYTSFDIRY